MDTGARAGRGGVEQGVWAVPGLNPGQRDVPQGTAGLGRRGCLACGLHGGLESPPGEDGQEAWDEGWRGKLGWTRPWGLCQTGDRTAVQRERGPEGTLRKIYPGAGKGGGAERRETLQPAAPGLPGP